MAVLIGGFVVYGYRRIKPPPPKPIITVESPRIKLSDGRFLSYRERGVSKQNAKFKVIVVHGFDSSKDIYLPLTQVYIGHMFS